MLGHQAIRRLREHNNISQRQLARRLGWTRNYISMFENGKRKISVKNEEKILKAIYEN